MKDRKESPGCDPICAQHPKQANTQTETDEHCRGLGGVEETTLGRCRALPEGEDFSGADKSILGLVLLTIPQLRKRSKSHCVIDFLKSFPEVSWELVQGREE